MDLGIECYEEEIRAATKAYELCVICVEKTPDEFNTVLISLMKRAIEAYRTRGLDHRHGIALDKQLTVILSQNNESPDRPLCGIYFNLHSPYKKKPEKSKL